MLNLFDDYPIHQTPEPIAHPATSDRNFYDRTWFNGYSTDGNWYFGIGMAIYPHRGVMDCAFSIIEKGGRQHSFFASRRAPLERTEMHIGPFRLEILEPMRRTRVVLDDNKTGLACDIIFSTRTAPVQEARQTLWAGSRRYMDATRFDQFGHWEGHIRHPDGGINITPQNSHGTKDRSWGVRGVGEPETGGAPKLSKPTVFFLWAPLFWNDHASHALFFEGANGETFCSEGFNVPLRTYSDEITDMLTPKTEHMRAVNHRLQYHPGTRFVSYAEIDMINRNSDIRTIKFEPLLRFHMKGLGYHHPKWTQGAWQGELEIGGESFDPSELKPCKYENIHVQEICRVTDDTHTGIGALEHVCFGPYAPYALQNLFDGPQS